MISGNRVSIIIPARYGSTRLPAKPLLEVAGKPIIQWVWEKALKSKYADDVIIAVDDKRIFDACMNFGAEVELTDVNHNCGSNRIAEVASRHNNFEYIINLQGDEPMIEAEIIDKLIEALDDDNVAMSTLVREITTENAQNPNCVKCVFDDNLNALYFSRSPIPYSRNPEYVKYFGHIGMYGYKKETLIKMVQSAQNKLELAESLEQLRVLGMGEKIKVALVELNPIGIDTLEDYEKFKSLIEGKLA